MHWSRIFFSQWRDKSSGARLPVGRQVFYAWLTYSNSFDTLPLFSRWLDLGSFEKYFIFLEYCREKMMKKDASIQKQLKKGENNRFLLTILI